MNRRHCNVWFIWLMGGCLMAATVLRAAESSRVVIQAHLNPSTNIVVGQPVRLLLQVLGRDGWAQIPNLPDIEVAGAQVLRIETQGIRIQETLQGESYTGQRYEMFVYPQREGTFVIPQTPVEVTIRQWGAGAAPITEQTRTPTLEFAATLPPGVVTAQGLISTTRFQAEQDWAPTTNEFLVGATLKRTLRFEAENVPGMLIPPLKKPAIDGVTAYPAQPDLNDAVDRGDLTGRRTESMTYLFRQSGSVTLPEVSITWWDLKSQELKRKTLPGLTVTVRPNPAVAATAAAGQAGGARSRILPVMVLLILASGLVVAWFNRRRLRQSYHLWKQRRVESESAHFRRFLAATEANDARLALRQVMRWLDRIHAGSGAARLDRFVARFGDANTDKVVDELLDATRENTSANWQGTHLRKALAEARRRWRRKEQRPDVKSPGLPALNPTILDPSVKP